ncbi:MAG TPA: alpha/beta hydrolase, partial [Anaeromyxobacter sp.]|nr:alpha/beta hydrolase [Anaeromyxobacter sp.]
MGALEAVAPALAERLAERLFTTPPRHAQPPGERAALAGGEPFAVRAGATIVRGHRIGAGPAVLLVHG